MSNNPTSVNKDSINLNVISPSSAPICFRDLPTSTSIDALKTKIWEASPVHPPPNTQRLIYRGHVMTQPERTLKEIFSQELINDAETLTIHLITPPSNQPRHPSPQTPPVASPQASTIEDQARPPPHHVQQVTFSAMFNGQPVQLPQQAPQAPQANLPTGNQQTNRPEGASAQGSTPAATNGPSQPQGGTSRPVNPQFQAHINAIQAQAQALLNNQLAAMQQHPMFAAQMPMMFQNGAPNMAHQQHPQPQAQQSPSPSTGFHVNQPGQIPFPHNAHHFHQQATPTRQQNSRPHTPSPLGSIPSAQHSLRPDAVPEASASHFRHSPRQQNDIRSSAGPWSSNPAATPTGLGYPPSTLNASQNGTFVGFPSTYTQTPPPFVRQQISSRSETPSLYLLSSPSGPQALLVSPSGLFSTPWFTPQPRIIPQMASSHLRHAPSFRQLNHDRPHPSNASTLETRRQMEAGQPAVPAVAPGPAQARAQAHVQVQALPNHAHAIPANPERDIGRIAAQISSHLWMLVRLFGFIWFFSHGASTSRTIMLCLGGTLVFFGQIGLFQGLWQRVRRQVDDILRGGAHAPPNNVNPNQNTNTGVADPSATTPEQVAERLLAERRGQEGNAIRQTLRRCERAAMLFFGSLAPGLAERHIQARNEAESARQREIQAHEEREKLKEESRKAVAADSEPTNAAKVDVGSSNASSSEPAGATGAPVVEV